MDRRTTNVEIFNDSVSLMRENDRLKKAVENSIRNQRLYLEKEELPTPADKGLKCRIVISKKRSFEAASVYALAGKKVAVHNFASATNPGGGVTRGSTAQEECICRCSTLFPCLDNDKMWQQFYLPHRRAGNPLYNDDCLYTPDVVVFKSDIVFQSEWQRKIGILLM